MIQEEIQNWIYEIKEVDALSAKALLRVYEQLGLSAAADRLGAISSEQTNVEYASVWLWAVERNPERRESLNKIREELTAKYCSENSKDVHLTGQQVFYELSFFTEYETKYGNKGVPSKQIADKLNISIYTVDRHRQDILASLKVANTAAAVEIALRMNLI